MQFSLTGGYKPRKVLHMNQININKISKEEILLKVYKMLDLLVEYEISQKNIAKFIGVSDNWLNAKSIPNSDSWINLNRLYKQVKEQRLWY
jgi:hypothetical protein